MIETTCKDCVFAQLKNDKQHGCQLNRLEKLGFRESDAPPFGDGKYFTVERFCNTARPQEWLDSLSFEESLDLKKTVMKEVYPRVGILINFDTEQDQPLEKLQHSISQLLSQEHTPRYVIVCNQKVEYNEAIQEMLASNLPESTEHHIVQLIRKFENKIEIIDECFRHALNGWMYVTTCGEEIPNTLMQTLNRIINEDMEKITIVKPYDGFNGMIFQAVIFKFLNGNKPKAWTVEEIDDRPFLEKAKDLDQENTIMSWEEFYAKLS